MVADELIDCLKCVRIPSMRGPGREVHFFYFVRINEGKRNYAKIQNRYLMKPSHIWPHHIYKIDYEYVVVVITGMVFV